MKAKILLVCLFTACFCPLFADMDIAGVVVDSDSKAGIASAQISLAQDRNVFVNSDQSGAFHFVYQGSQIAGSSAASAGRISVMLSGKQFSLNPGGAKSIRLSILNILGQELFSYQYENPSSRNIALSERVDMDQLQGVLFFRFNIDGNVYARKVVCLNDRVTCQLATNSNSAHLKGSPLAKAASILDLRVTKVGYIPKIYTPSLTVETQVKIELAEDNSAGAMVLALVHENVMDYLNEELTNYANDIKNELGLNLNVKRVSSNETVHSLKSYVLDYNAKNNLNGVLLVGNVPTGVFQPPPANVAYGAVLNDFIYQDILDACDFSQELNNFSSNRIECQNYYMSSYWVARLTPNSSITSDIELLKGYFKLNHDFRNGLHVFEQKALLYQPILLDVPGSEQTTIDRIKNEIAGFGGVYQPQNYMFVDIFSGTSDNVYLSELSKGYETVIYNGHGAPTFHHKNITSLKISSAAPNFFFGLFNTCSVGRFTTKDYIAGEYLFGGGLVSLAASVPIFGSSEFNAEFYSMLVNNVPFYKALNVWGQGAVNILGDPTLKMRYGSIDPPPPSILVSADKLEFSEINPVRDFIIENTGNSPLYFSTSFRYSKQKNCDQFLGFTYQMNPDLPSNPELPFDLSHRLDAFQKTTITLRSGDFFPYEKIPAGTYNGTLFVVSSDKKKSYNAIDLSFVNGVHPPSMNAISANARPGGDNTTVLPGGSALVNVWNDPGNVLDQVGLFPVGAGNDSPLSWKYLSNTQFPPTAGNASAKLDFVMPLEVGNYEFRLMGNNGLDSLASSNVIIVANP